MSAPYVMDACALIAFLRKESGWECVKDILKRAYDNTAIIHMHAFNLLEVYYDMYRSVGKEKADEEINLIKHLPIIFNSNLSDNIFIEAGRLKANYSISLADAIALAQTKIADGVLLTSDHHEFDVIEVNEPIQFLWIR